MYLEGFSWDCFVNYNVQRIHDSSDCEKWNPQPKTSCLETWTIALQLSTCCYNIRKPTQLCNLPTCLMHFWWWENVRCIDVCQTDTTTTNGKDNTNIPHDLKECCNNQKKDTQNTVLCVLAAVSTILELYKSDHDLWKLYWCLNLTTNHWATKATKASDMRPPEN